MVRNPFGGGSGHVRRSHEVRDPLDDLSARLARLGASDDDIAELRTAWNDPDAEFAIPRNELVRMDDATLAKLIADADAEYDDHTDADALTDDGDDGRGEPGDARVEGEALIAAEVVEAWEAEKVADMAIGDTLAWIGTDVERARLVLAQEVLRGDAARKGIVEPLETSLSDAQDDAGAANDAGGDQDTTENADGDTDAGS